MLLLFLKKILPTRFKTFLKKFRKFNAINSIDKKLLKYLNFKEGCYIECGANDGVNQSNTWYFEKCLNWSGILIEPNKNLFLKLKKNRSSNNIFVNSALVSDDFKKNNRDIYLTEGNLEAKLINTNVSKSHKVTTDTLNSILSKAKIFKIDLFSLDVEGYEEEVLKGVNLDIYDIRFILIETNHFHKINDLLMSSNYSFIEKLSFHDYLFKKNTISN